MIVVQKKKIDVPAMNNLFLSCMFFAGYVRNSTNYKHKINRNMKIFFLMLIGAIGLASCNNSNCTSKAEIPVNDPTIIDHVEVIYFHGRQRCATCKAVENATKELIDNAFLQEVRNGSVTLKIVDISTPEGETLADEYEVSWSSLFVNKWKDGKETRTNITESAFVNALKSPETFKQILTESIHKNLE